MTKPRYLDRNIDLVRTRLNEQVKISLDKGNKFIEKEMTSNLYALVKPIVKFFFNEVKRKDMEAGGYKQIELTIKAARDVILEDTSLEMAISRYFPSYLQADQTYQTLKKNHRNYRKLVDNTKDVFREQVRPLITLLQNDSDDINTYEQLAKDTFKIKEETLKALTGQFQYMEQGLKWIKEDLTILNVPMGRDILYKILIQGYRETVNELKADTEAMFNE